MKLHQLGTASKPGTATSPRAVPPSPEPPKPITLGLLVGNRGFFPGHLAQRGRTEMLAALKEEGFEVVVLDADASRYGAIESRDEAKACAALFREHRHAIAGIVVTLPNFGDERAVADTLRLADLDVPVLVHASADVAGKMTIADRRDSFCGKISVCNVLTQYGIPFSLTTRHTDTADSPTFRADLRRFAGVCRVVHGLRTVRIGAIGARPAAFNTVRYSEKILESGEWDLGRTDRSLRKSSAARRT